MPIESGTRVGRYRVVRLIAQGGMAEVYRADQEIADGFVRPAALKVIRPEFAGSADFREMFLDEARLACALSHPNIVHIYEVGEVSSLVFMAMELVQGESLSMVNRMLRTAHKRFSPEALLAVGIFTCSALEAVHNLKVLDHGHVNLVHRDVSPHNLLLSPQGALKLIDFGIAKAASNRNLTTAGLTKGKAGYFSPEQAMGKKLDGRSDLFSLGVMLYKLASGRTPFDQHRTHHNRNAALVRGQWRPLRKVCRGLPEPLYEVVERALQLRPEDRFRSAAQMREGLERVANRLGVQIGPASLAGFVAEDDGQRSNHPTATGAQLGPAVTHQPKVDDPRRAQVQAAKRRRALSYAAITLGLSAALGLTLAGLFRKWGAPLPARTLVAMVLPVQVTESPLSVAPLLVKGAVRASVPNNPPPEPQPLKALPPPKPVPMPPGEGQLRISSSPDGLVIVSGAKWGNTPLSRRIPSGRYVVEIVSDRDRVSCPVKVWPDQTTRLRYDFSSGHCAPDSM